MPLRTDIWRIAVVDRPVTALDAADDWRDGIHWLPEEPPFTFLADPFGLWRDGRLHVFAEAFDYRTRHGVIDLIELDAAFVPIRRTTVLREPWHLSYPQVFEHDGEVWMLPEAHRSGALTLYRAAPYPERWEPALRLPLDGPAVDATVFQWEGLWWLAYSPSGPQSYKQGRLHLAYAERLLGPWRTHPGNPVRIDRRSSRPGGAPFLRRGRLILPVQDCSRTYGGAIRWLRIQALTPDRFEAIDIPGLRAPRGAAPYVDGLHTVSACGPVTLIDVKRIDRSPGGLLLDLGRRLRRTAARTSA
ncbi:MAG: hypothetical protein JNL41_08880 [Phenylobacterium sp.]|uniref:glucosamine inositolphosphorylceramide transferase family protein n=1 Tax=Phenylobacterium sp. TaxID=1871053 RepID=UPI001A4859E5|nr:hypothetical protein [Phenylobacterium sp.]MBL8554378.1 hypothetical protein [Phenylobacterium sp.]